MKLSTDDLALFFDPAHDQLAVGLRRARAELARAEQADSAHERHAAVARAMGTVGLYHWLLPGAGDAAGQTGEPGDTVARPVESVADVRALCLIREFLGYVSPLADAIFAVQGLGSYPVLLSHASAAAAAADSGIRFELLSACRAGTSIGGFALTEPEAGSDVASMRSTARRKPDGDEREYLLSGQKTLISNVGIAAHYVVFANANPDAGRRGICAFLVKSGSPGLREQAIELNVDHPMGALHMDDCPGVLLGEMGAGFRLAMQTLDTFRVTVGAAAVGMARRALDEALAHVKGRVQFGAPLAANQVIQSMLANMATELDAARLLVLRAAHAKDRAMRAQVERERRAELSQQAAMAKLYATEAAQRIIDSAVQLFGGRGVTSGQVVENLYRSIRPLRIYEGTSEIQRLIIGRTLTK